MIREREHVGIGWDVAGTIDAIGPEVTAFAAGDRVIGLRDRLDQPLGTYAERIVLDAADVAAAPTGVTSVAASTIPLKPSPRSRRSTPSAWRPGRPSW